MSSHSPKITARFVISKRSLLPGVCAFALLALLVSMLLSCAGRKQASQAQPPATSEQTQPAQAESERRVLRVCADPNNLPFSNQKLEGFENKIAELIAQEMGVKIQWSWRAQRRGFFRESLKESTADLVLGAPAGYERALTTTPYYRSSYVFV